MCVLGSKRRVADGLDRPRFLPCRRCNDDAPCTTSRCDVATTSTTVSPVDGLVSATVAAVQPER